MRTNKILSFKADMEDKLKAWSSIASHFVGEHFDHCKPFLDKDYQGLDPLVRFVSTQLYISCQMSSQSSLILLREGQEWDADIINRSLIEGVVKYVYMLSGDETERLEKVKEYWKILPEFSSIKRSSRVKSFLNAKSGDVNNDYRPFEDLLLDDVEIEELRNGTNKKERKLLDQKWSFSNIVSEFSKSDDKGLSLFSHLAHNYGMSSHLIHKDGDGIAMIWDRCTRPEERMYAAKLSHSARVISDVCSFAELRTIFLMKACNQELDVIHVLKENYKSLFDELNDAYKSFLDVEYET